MRSPAHRFQHCTGIHQSAPAGRQENGARRASPCEATSPPSLKQGQEEKTMEFLVEFEVTVPDGDPGR